MSYPLTVANQYWCKSVRAELD